MKNQLNSLKKIPTLLLILAGCVGSLSDTWAMEEEEPKILPGHITIAKPYWEKVTDELRKKAIETEPLNQFLLALQLQLGIGADVNQADALRLCELSAKGGLSTRHTLS